MGGLDFLRADDPVATDTDRARGGATSGLETSHAHGSSRLVAFQGSQFHVNGQTVEGFGGIIRQACVRKEGGGLVYQLELPVTAAARAQEVYREYCDGA